MKQGHKSNSLKTALCAAALSLFPLSPLLATETPPEKTHSASLIEEVRTPQMRAFVTVNRHLVMLSDIFRFIEPEQDAAVFRAPDLGQSGKVSTARVEQAAKRAGLAHYDTAGFNEITVSRQSLKIEKEALEQHVIDALSQRLAISADYLSVNLSTPLKDLHLDPSHSGLFDVEKVSLYSNGFSLTLSYPQENQAQGKKLRIDGKVIELVDVVKLKETIKRGEEISAAHLETAKVPKNTVAASTLFHTADVIGMVARRSLRAESLVREQDIEEKRLVEKDEMVLMSYRVGKINLSVKGKALEDGVMGEVIRVRNLQSEKVIEAVVVALGRVDVNPPTQPKQDIAANTSNR